MNNEEIKEYNENNKLIHYKDSGGNEYFWKYDKNKPIRITEKDYNKLYKKE